MSPPENVSVYCHVPFCLAKCPYCDFYSASAGDLGMDPWQYFELVERELDVLCCEDERLRSRRLVTFYVGGGTPTLVEPGAYRRFFERLCGAFELDPSFEWTLEANPGTLDEKRRTDNRQLTTDNGLGTTGGPDRLDAFLALGVNRLSIGVQSFSDETLEQLGRRHRSAEARALLDQLRDAGRPQPIWAIDLIFGAPGQTLSQWQADLDEAIAYRPHHCSVYGLTIHEGTPFGDQQRAGHLDLPDEETQREMFLLARRRLTLAGYEHYEISNYALPGCRSRHNERYWTGGDYLGLGVAAHSQIGGIRWSNPPDLALYRESLATGRLPRRIERPPGDRARVGEQVMLGLRRLEGIDLAAFRSRFGVDLAETYSREIARLAGGRLVEIVDGRLRLSEAGLLVADAVMAEFF